MWLEIILYNFFKKQSLKWKAFWLLAWVLSLMDLSAEVRSPVWVSAWRKCDSTFGEKQNGFKIVQSGAMRITSFCIHILSYRIWINSVICKVINWGLFLFWSNRIGHCGFVQCPKNTLNFLKRQNKQKPKHQFLEPRVLSLCNSFIYVFFHFLFACILGSVFMWFYSWWVSLV